MLAAIGFRLFFHITKKLVVDGPNLAHRVANSIAIVARGLIAITDANGLSEKENTGGVGGVLLSDPAHVERHRPIRRSKTRPTKKTAKKNI
jgi:hypothetical protein